MNDTARRLLAEVTRLEQAGALAHQRLRAIRLKATPVTESVPPPVPAPPGTPPDFDDSSFPPSDFLTRAEEVRAHALLAAATLLGPVLAADATAGRVGPLTGNDLRAILTHAERAWLKLAGQAEAWITGGDGS